MKTDDTIQNLINENIQKNKELCERMPYLIPINPWTGKIPKGYDYSYIAGEYDLPKGWQKLFLQMCEEILPVLEKTNFKEKFQFSQIKEKFGWMRVYTFGAPEEVRDIIAKYEHVSGYVCSECGRPASFRTKGYILPYCNDCWKDIARHEDGDFIKFNPTLTRIYTDKEEKIDCSYIWKKLYGEKEEET